MEGLPPLNLSSGPAVSEAASGGSMSTGAFNFKGRAPTLIEQITPLIFAGAFLWVLTRR
jgi:hypothetical protein